MFTGLIADVASVAALRRNGAGATLEVRSRLAGELDKGDSIAVNGVCLTVSDVEAGAFQAKVMAETLSRSSLGDLQPGSEVNLELPLRSGERLGGHIVQGHIDGTGTVSAVHEDGFGRVLEIGIDEQLARYVVEKGSVAVDGVSLTVSALHDHGFAVSLIPETLKRTNLGRIGEGAVVNVEVDILAKHVERLIGAQR